MRGDATAGRLTRQDRHSIARWLGDGLAYAEIARRLNRATSTITREVLRNGGPSSYRADPAHRATERRSRRGGAAKAGQRDASQDQSGGVTREYEQRLTGALVASGLSMMTARVLSCLLITDTGSRTAAELAQHLAVSPASVSRAVALLEEQTLLRRERDNRRRERYIVDDGMWYQSTIATARTNAHVSDIARRGATVLGAHSPAATRLDSIADFLDVVSDGLLRAVEHASRATDTSRPATITP